MVDALKTIPFLDSGGLCWLSPAQPHTRVPSAWAPLSGHPAGIWSGGLRGSCAGAGILGDQRGELHGEQQGLPREAVGLGSGSGGENHWGAPPQWQPGRAGSRWERKQEMEDRRREEKRADEARTKGERLRWAKEVLGQVRAIWAVGNTVPC